MKARVVRWREELRGRIGGYVRERVLPVLGVAGAPFELSVAPAGTRSAVLFLDSPAGRHVLKGVRDPIFAAQTALAMRHLRRRGAPVPRLVHHDLSPRTRWTLGVVVLVEEGIRGENLSRRDRTPAVLDAAADALARLHSIRRPRWGSLLPGLGRRGGYVAHLERRRARRLEELAAVGPALADLARPAVDRWFAREARERSPDAFSLCHRRVTRTNVLHTDDGDAVLIDVGTARYGDPAFDLERALQRWCGADDVRRGRFLDRYFARAPALDRGRWERVRPYHRASFHLTQVTRAAKELEGLRADGAPHKIEKRLRSLSRHAGRLVSALGTGRTPLSAAERSDLLAATRDGLALLRRDVETRAPLAEALTE
ncbi:MAG: phosphotransferase family protein [Planctomycetota bacterium JB042]